MRAGRLNTRVELQEPHETQDVMGEVSVSYVTRDAVWADWETPSGEESPRGHKGQARAKHRLTMRLYPSFTSRWRVKVGGGDSETLLYPSFVVHDKVSTVAECGERVD